MGIEGPSSSVEIPEGWRRCEITGVFGFNMALMPMVPIITGATMNFFDPQTGVLRIEMNWGDEQGEDFPAFIEELAGHEGVEINFS